MSITATERKSQRLVARVSQRHKKMFERAAAIEGRSVAAFVVAHALEAANRLVSQQAVVRLNAEESRRFAEALLAAPQPIPKPLRQALRAYKRQVVNHLQTL